MAITVGGTNITMNSGAVVQDPPGTASCYMARAWVNFNATGSVSANQTIRASGNVSSVFKNASGDYTINFSTALSDANYTAIVTSSVIAAASTVISNINSTLIGGLAESAPTSSAMRLITAGWNGTAYNPTYVSVAIFR